jgi:perosamine synthetase
MTKQSGENNKTRMVRMFIPYVSKSAVERVSNTLQSGYIGEGPVVADFEKGFNTLIGTRYSLALSSCTAALHLALAVCNVGPGDEVITTAQTMAATSHTVLAHYAKPVYADIQYLTGNIDPQDIEHRITARTKAIVAVHWAGYPCDMEKILVIAGKHKIAVIEDAAHAIGAIYKGIPVGTISPFTCFSFQAVKHITTGDGGMLCCTQEAAYHKARRLRWYGIDRKNRKPSELGEPIWDMAETGYKYHMNDIAASMGVEHLRELSDILERRRLIARIYRQELKDVPGITLFESRDDRKSAYWLFTIHVDNRLEFVRMLKSRGVEASVVHLRIDANTVFGPLREDLVNLGRFNKSQISIPVHNMLTDKDVEHIIRSIKGGW